jgi:hypothetical protein
MGDAWLVGDDASEKVDVDINQLKDFAEAIKQELKANFQPSFTAGIKPLMTVRAPFNAGELNEAKWFGHRHQDTAEAILALCAEVQLGLAALAAAAMSISNEYVGSDAFGQATFDDVNDAFAPLEGNQTLQGLLNANDKTQTADVGGNETVPIPEGADDPTKYDDIGDGGDKADDGKGDGDRPDIYDDKTVGSGGGEYKIGGDDEGTWNKEVNPKR